MSGERRTPSSELRRRPHSHHLAGDLKFARALPAKRRPLQISVVGDVAWAVGTPRRWGRSRDGRWTVLGLNLSS